MLSQNLKQDYKMRKTKERDYFTMGKTAVLWDKQAVSFSRQGLGEGQRSLEPQAEWVDGDEGWIVPT